MFYIARSHMLAALAAAVLASLPSKACHAAYPEQLIKIIVGFPPGGSSDVVIRALEPLVSADLKQGLVIENRAGAGGNIGMTAVAQAKPDGYTLGVAPAGALTVNPHLNQPMPFDPKELAPITLLVIRSCRSKTSSSWLSNRSAQRCAPVAASINCPVMRTRLPALRTLPSST